MRTIEAAARLSGFFVAARKLELTQLSVSAQIKLLGIKLGHELLVRHLRKSTVDEAGKAYLPSVREGFDKLSHATY